jgi:hypothetical protein
MALPSSPKRRESRVRSERIQTYTHSKRLTLSHTHSCLLYSTTSHTSCGMRNWYNHSYTSGFMPSALVATSSPGLSRSHRRTLDASFGRWLQQRRKALGLTQAELGRQVSCATVTTHRRESEDRLPSPAITSGWWSVSTSPRRSILAHEHAGRSYASSQGRGSVTSRGVDPSRVGAHTLPHATVCYTPTSTEHM